MGRKNRRKENRRDREISGTDESDESSPRNRGIPRVPAIEPEREHRAKNVTNQIDNQGSSGRSYHDEGSSLFHLSGDETIFGPWVQAVSETLNKLSAAQRAINGLQEKFTSHVKDFQMVDEIKQRLHLAEQQAREKDDELQKHEHTIQTLTSMDRKSKAEVETRSAQLKAEWGKLEQEKAKIQSRIAVATEEERHSMRKECEERTNRDKKSHETRMKELETEFSQKKAENSARATALEAKKEELVKTTKLQQNKIKAQEMELDRLKENNDTLNRAKDSLRSENQALQQELEGINKEFALNTESTAHFQDKFAEVYEQIAGISQEYFHDIEDKNLEEVHKELANVDPCFEPVPIDDSDDSRELCTAHAQRVISAAICQIIWKPFSSELTFMDHRLSNLLGQLLDNLDRSSLNRRTANVWAALTMRALQLSNEETVTQPVPDSNQSLSATASLRADGVINNVLQVLSPLVSSSQITSLRADIFAVVDSAVEIWNDAQSGGLKITIDLQLDYAHHAEWRSLRFDPVLPSDPQGPYPDRVSNTRPRVFTLFPRVTAQAQNKFSASSWPDSEPVVIHPGIGLPEWSMLVIRGKAGQEESQDYLKKVLEEAKKEWHNSRRGSKHAKETSRQSSISGAQSPSAQWKMGGAMDVPEK